MKMMLIGAYISCMHVIGRLVVSSVCGYLGEGKQN